MYFDPINLKSFSLICICLTRPCVRNKHERKICFSINFQNLKFQSGWVWARSQLGTLVFQIPRAWLGSRSYSEQLKIRLQIRETKQGPSLGYSKQVQIRMLNFFWGDNYYRVIITWKFRFKITEHFGIYWTQQLLRVYHRFGTFWFLTWLEFTMVVWFWAQAMQFWLLTQLTQIMTLASKVVKIDWKY